MSKKKFKFDEAYKNDTERLTWKDVQSDPTKSTGMLGVLGKDLVAKIGTHILYNHTWVEFICTCPLAFKACTTPGFNPRPKWNIIYDKVNGRRVHWTFDNTKGYYDIHKGSIFLQVINPECIQLKNMANVEEDAVTIVIYPLHPLNTFRLKNGCLRRMSGKVEELGEYVSPEYYRNIPPFVDELGVFLVGLYCEYHSEEDDFDDLDYIFAVRRSVRFNRCIYIQSSTTLKAIESELKFFIHHLGLIIN